MEGVCAAVYVCGCIVCMFMRVCSSDEVCVTFPFPFPRSLMLLTTLHAVQKVQTKSAFLGRASMVLL